MNHPPASSPAVRERMRSQRCRSTVPEIRLRSELARLGYVGVPQYRLPLPRRTADTAFPGHRVAVFVDGCFWHGCPDHSRSIRSNGEWWRTKIAANRRRDADTDRRLAALGWTAVRVWEHDDPVTAAAVVETVLTERAVHFGRISALSTGGQGQPPADINHEHGGIMTTTTKDTTTTTKAPKATDVWWVNGKKVIRSRPYSLAWVALEHGKHIDGPEHVSTQRLREVLASVGVADTSAPPWQAVLPNGIHVAYLPEGQEPTDVPEQRQRPRRSVKTAAGKPAADPIAHAVSPEMEKALNAGAAAARAGLAKATRQVTPRPKPTKATRPTRKATKAA